MWKTLTLLVVAVMSTMAVGEGLANSPVDVVCPTISIECPEDVFEKDSDLIFKAHVGANSLKWKYRWEVGWVPGFRKGRIKARYMHSIVISAKGPARRGLTVTYSIIGLPKRCPNQASCTTIIASPK